LRAGLAKISPHTCSVEPSTGQEICVLGSSVDARWRRCAAAAAAEQPAAAAAERVSAQ
jgi:hypothetical protein